MMKTLAPWFASIGAAIMSITTAVGTQRGAFAGKAPLTPYLSLYALSVTAFVLAAILYYKQEDTPQVIPLRYGVDPERANDKVGAYGLIVTNSGATAFEVHIASEQTIGGARLVFKGEVSVLTKDSEGFFPIERHLTLDQMVELGDMFDDMEKYNVDGVPITMAYRDIKRRSYKTTCKLHRNVISRRGLTITDVQTERE